MKNITIKIIVIILFTLGITFSEAQISFESMQNYTTGSGPYSVAKGDFNKDGYLDFVVANSGFSTVSLLLGSFSGNIVLKYDYSTGNMSAPQSVVVGDLNNDGNLDFATVDFLNSKLNIFTKVGNTFTFNRTDYNTNGSPSNLALGLINNDNLLDIVVTNLMSNSISVFTNTGNSFVAMNPITVGLAPFGIAIGQFNQDFITDIAITNSGGSNITILTGTGMGAFGTFQISTGGRPRGIAVADFTDDGKLDLAVTSLDNDNLMLLTGTGRGSFSLLTELITNMEPYSVAIEDLNGDEKLDLVVANKADNNLSIFTNLGNGRFTSKTDIEGLNEPYSAIIGNFNNDKKQDIAVVNSTKKTMSMLINNTFFPYPFVTEWDLSTNTGENLIDKIIFGVETNGNAQYRWTTLPTVTASGSGSFSGTNATITGIPLGAKISLSIDGSNFNRIFMTNSDSRNRLVNISSWGHVIWNSMNRAFESCINLNISANDIPNLSNVSSMAWMFSFCENLNSPSNIQNWNVSKVSSFIGTFAFASSFNQPLGNWDISNASNISSMFAGATAFNQPIGSWNTSKVTDMNNMFYYSSSFDRPIGNWNTTACSNMSTMFAYASKFNQPIENWNTSNVLNMSGMFASASSFNQSIGGWNTSNVTNMQNMFGEAFKFNQPLNSWNTSNVINMTTMFVLASDFNQPLENWDISNVTSMSRMFFKASNFNQSFNSWGIKLNSNVDMFKMLDNTALSVANYDATLKGFAAGTVTGRTLGANGLKYCSALNERNLLTLSVLNNKNWTITGDFVTPMSIKTQPISKTVCPNTMTTFAISVDGIGLNYIWSNGLSTTSSMMTSTLGNNYQVTVTGACGMVVSTVVSLLEKPSITGILIPSTENVTIGGTSSVIIPTLAGLNFNYESQWVYNNSVLTVVSDLIASPINKYVRPNNSNSQSFRVLSINGADLIYDFVYKQKSCETHPFTVSNPMRFIDVSTQIYSNIQNLESFFITPNPVFNTDWKVENTEFGLTMYLYNSQGLVVYSQITASNTTFVKVKLSKGIYLLKIGNKTKKLIIE